MGKFPLLYQTHQKWEMQIKLAGTARWQFLLVTRTEMFSTSIQQDYFFFWVLIAKVKYRAAMESASGKRGTNTGVSEAFRRQSISFTPEKRRWRM